MKNKKKNAKLKSFFFKDYQDSEISFNKNNNKLVKILPNRVTFLFCVFLSLVFIFSIKIIYLSLFPEKNFYLSNNKNHFINERADIIDRNGAILARNIDIYSAGIRPQLVQDKKKFLINLKLVFPELDIQEVKKKLIMKTFST